MCTWHPEMATCLPKTDLCKNSLVNTIPTNVAGYLPFFLYIAINPAHKYQKIYLTSLIMAASKSMRNRRRGKGDDDDDEGSAASTNSFSALRASW
jgi:hypothetical protein